MHLLSSSINCDLQICSAVTLTNIIMNWIKRELKCCEVNIVWKSDLSKFRGVKNSTFVKSRQMYFPNKAGTEFLKKSYISNKKLLLERNKIWGLGVCSETQSWTVMGLNMQRSRVFFSPLHFHESQLISGWHDYKWWRWCNDEDYGDGHDWWWWGLWWY